MIVVNAVELFPSENLAQAELSNGKKYKILIRDYENLPFDCRSGSRLENITIDVDKISLSETNRYFDGDCVEFLAFLSKKYSIYRSAISKVALSDVPKKQLCQKLYFAVCQNNKTKTEPEVLKALCGLVCDEFEAAGYVDDRRYAADKARYLKEYKKYGNGRIKEHLYHKGVPADIINEILEDELFADEDSDLENMRALLKKKYGESLDRLDKSDRADIQKAINLLIRGGYKYQQAKNAVAELIDADITETGEYDDE